MYLNIDLGSLYIKVSVLEPKERKVLQSEVIRLERNTKGVIEVLINSIVETYSKNFDIKKVFILPNLSYIDCEVINHESLIESKYQSYMKRSLSEVKKEEKKKQRMGSEYQPPKESNITFKYNVLDNEVFHCIEKRDLMSSLIYVEYINSEYLKGLNSIVNSLGKEVALISPIRAMKYLPFPKENRIIVNYGHRNIVAIVIEDGNIVEVLKEKVEGSLKPLPEELEEKHERISLDDDPTYMGKVADIQRLKAKYNYPLYLIGGQANYLQSDLMNLNVVDSLSVIPTPLVVENLLLPTTVLGYKDFQYNSVGMKLKNQVLNLFNISSRASNLLIGIAGDLVIAGMIIGLITSYGVTAEKQAYDYKLSNLQSVVATYTGEGESKGKLKELEERLEALQNGKTRNYYNIAEFLDSLSSPLEVESITVEGKNIEIVAYADNVALIKQFLSTVKAKQVLNEFTKFSLSEQDIRTVYRNGGKVDRVVFKGKIY